jgi:hypothetical protein
MSNLGHRTATGRLAVGTLLNRVTAGGWVIEFPPQVLPSDSDYEVWHASIRGPGGYFLVYLDDIQYGVSANGRINEYAPASSAMYVRKGQAISLHWSIASGAAPNAWIFLREPEVGQLT